MMLSATLFDLETPYFPAGELDPVVMMGLELTDAEPEDDWWLDLGYVAILDPSSV